MYKSSKMAVYALAVVMVLFAGCGGGAKTESVDTAAKTRTKKMVLPFPQFVEREGTSVGGTLVCGVISDNPWKGEFNTFLYQDSITYSVMGPMLGRFMRAGLNSEIINGGGCDMSFDRENKTATFHIREDLTWSDGVPVTADDLIFVYESICHPDYDGVRYDGSYENVVGVVEFHEGKASSISGLKKLDDKTLQVTFKKFRPSILWGDGLPYNPEPAHYLKGIPLKQLSTHERVRKHPLSCGPFVINSMVEGDILEYVPNPHWKRSKVKLDKIIFKRIAPTSAVQAVKSGEVDKLSLPAYTYDQIVHLDDQGRPVKDENGNIKMKLDNADVVNYIDRSYSYVGFKLGTWDAQKAECVPFADGGKFKDKALRKAIAYAMDNDGVNEIFYHGLRVTPNSFITPAHPGFYDETMEGYFYDPEKAKQLLDEAGYKDVDGDGFRETPDGKPLTINLLFMSGGDIAEPLANYYVQNWRDVGLNVSLNDGRLIEFNAFYDKVKEDDPNVEMYVAGWGVGSDPNPSGLYARTAQFNYPRWVNEKNDECLDKINSEEAFDEEFRAQAYRAWDENIMEELPVIPIGYRLGLTLINKRVKFWDERPASDFSWEDVELISDKTAVNTLK